MNDLKTIIDHEVSQLLPLNFEKSISDKVMGQIIKPQYSFLPSVSSHSDNLKLILLVLISSLIIYIFGFNESYRIRIYISNELITSIAPKILLASFVVLFLLNDYFEQKKRVLI